MRVAAHRLEEKGGKRQEHLTAACRKTFFRIQNGAAHIKNTASWRTDAGGIFFGMGAVPRRDVPRPAGWDSLWDGLHAKAAMSPKPERRGFLREATSAREERSAAPQSRLALNPTRFRVFYRFQGFYIGIPEFMCE